MKSRAVAQTIDALFAPLPVVESRGRAWLVMDHQLKPVNLRRGISIHGWAVNLATPAAMWRLIRPCGGDSPQLSLSEARTLTGLPPLTETVAAVAAAVIPRLQAALPPVMRAVAR